MLTPSRIMSGLVSEMRRAAYSRKLCGKSGAVSR